MKVALATLVLLAGCGGDGEKGERIERFLVQSRLVGERLEQAAVIPPGETKGRPLLLFLHGRGMTPEDMATVELRDAVRRLGDKAPIVILPNGGDHSYFHDRRDGAWGSYVVGEVLPAAVRRYRADPKRVAIGGFSMGGFGALDLARTAPGLFCAVGGHDAALWFRASQTPEGAFDDAEDFHRHDILAAAQANPGLFGRARVWLDAGETDPFRRSTTALSRTLEGEAFHIWPGEHSLEYIRMHTAQYLDFYAQALEDCQLESYLATATTLPSGSAKYAASSPHPRSERLLRGRAPALRRRSIVSSRSSTRT